MGLSKEERSNWTKEQKRHYKRYGVTLYQPLKIEIAKPEVAVSPLNENCTVLCVRFGNKYGREYVERLRNMVSRNLNIPYEFVCLTDDQHPIEGVRSIYQPSAGYNKLWWHKIHMFDPDLDIKGRIIYFDLDLIIHDNIDKLLLNFCNQFLGIRDFNRKFHLDWKYLNSSVLSWTHGTQNKIFTEFKKNPSSAMKLHGDQDWIWRISGDKIVFWPDSWIQSYKWEIRSRDEIDMSIRENRTFKTVRNPSIPKDCSITVFHGDPNPDKILDPYVIDNWR
jgi:hypothetical protein